jgi:hypothetical protein
MVHYKESKAGQSSWMVINSSVEEFFISLFRLAGERNIEAAACASFHAAL